MLTLSCYINMGIKAIVYGRQCMRYISTEDMETLHDKLKLKSLIYAENDV